jgi:hypothetical protein
MSREFVVTVIALLVLYGGFMTWLAHANGVLADQNAKACAVLTRPARQAAL